MATLIVTDAHGQEHIIDAVDGLSLVELLRPRKGNARARSLGELPTSGLNHQGLIA